MNEVPSMALPYVAHCGDETCNEYHPMVYATVGGIAGGAIATALLWHFLWRGLR